MERDKDYLRELMLAFEAQADHIIPVADLIVFEGDRRRAGHVKLLIDEGLLESPGRGVVRITARGHDFIESIRDPGIWARTKEAVAETGGNATLDIVKQLATGFLKKKITQHTGIEL